MIIIINIVVRPDPPNSGTSDTSLNTGAIIGGIVAVVFILAVTVVVIASIALVLRRKQSKEFQPE